MRKQYKKIEGHLLLIDDLELHGMVTGNITVPAGKTLLLHGMCCGSLIIEAGARASIEGTVSGDVLNSGFAEIGGTVNGNVRSRNGKVHFSADCVIGGARDI